MNNIVHIYIWYFGTLVTSHTLSCCSAPSWHSGGREQLSSSWAALNPGRPPSASHPQQLIQHKPEEHGSALAATTHRPRLSPSITLTFIFVMVFCWAAPSLYISFGPFMLKWSIRRRMRQTSLTSGSSAEASCCCLHMIWAGWLGWKNSHDHDSQMVLWLQRIKVLLTDIITPDPLN